MYMKKVFKLDFDGRELVVETGELAKQTNGAVLVRYGDTAVLSVCVMGKHQFHKISFHFKFYIKKDCIQ